ncbi:MAG: SUMF1/EgtB/PvdO family nonheme iron enzyme [Treponema sp.]|jgi:hypothetical protein|nr:SUMF1/EgtB/PvdO family nonheme iron enzyme [Treponema sp.]
MLKKRPERQETEHEDQVRLKPLFGVKPGYYLGALYGLAILLVLFFLFLYPGLSRPGSLARVRSEPSGAAFRIDGVYRGTTPCDIFVPAGRHLVELSLPRFTPLRREEEFRGRLFGSRFFPLSRPVEGTLETGDPAAVFAFAAADYAAWTFAGEPTVSWQIPQSLSEGAYRAGPGLAAAKSGEGADAEGLDAGGILMAAARFAVTRAALRDLSRAAFLADNGGLSPSPVTLYRSATGMIRYLSENPGFAETLAGLLPEEDAGILTGSAWYRKQTASPSAGLPEGGDNAPVLPPPAGRDTPLRVGALNFIPLPEDGGASFLICETEVPKAVFERFLQERPEWGREETAALIERGLVNGDYLLDPSGGDSVTAVSWYAAAAFCVWLGESLPLSMSAWEPRLPTEAEWERAAGTGELPGMTGNVWEWCADPFVPLPFLPAPAAAAAAVGSPQRPVRGGAWINAGVDAGTRGSLPPELCSPFVSFRPVIAPRAGVRTPSAGTGEAAP